MSTSHVELDAFVVIKNGCPIKVTIEGPDFVQISCGQTLNDRFDFSIEHKAMRELAKLCMDTVAKMDSKSPQ
jgi:hypothetical protein